MESPLSIRALTSDDQETVWKFLRLAAHESTDVRDMKILQPYGQNFSNEEGDLGFKAVVNEKIVGAAWIRLLETGFAEAEDPTTPELAMAILPEHQGQGIGTVLLEKLLNSADQEVCLSCRRDNAGALHLYEKLGFQKLKEAPNRAGGSSLTMVRPKG